jgi:hypothetical protein
MPTLSPGDLDTLLTQGGAPRIALLRLCVMSVTPDPLFVFLVGEYRIRPAHAAALALYDAFCAPGALARIEAPGALPPLDLRLGSAIATLRQQWVQRHSLEPPDATNSVAVSTPPRHLFDAVAKACQNNPAGGYVRLAASYNPQRSPEEHLPGGRMTAGQRQFVEYVWKPRVRPGLIAAGFWRIADIE